MANLGNSKIQIAGKGHVYIGNVDTVAPNLWGYTFGDGTTLETAGWTWLGDTSSENLIEVETDGGDTSTKRTWDRQGVRSTREDVTNKVTINAVNLGEDVMRVAFPGSTYDAEKGGWDVELDNSSERAVLIVIEDGLLVSGMLFRRVSLAGNLPSLSLDNFSEVKISGTLLSPPSGKTRVQMLEPRTVTGVGTAKPTITTLAPATGAVGAKVTITGTNFNGVREVKFGDKVATFEKDSATQITTYVPRGATGAVNVAVTNNVGASDGKQFTVN
jgi:possible observed 21.5Kd protein|nr:MAG TPA: major tail protein [Caudoviricetes sp.]